MKFSDFAITTPKTTLTRGEEYAFVPMEFVDGQSKYPREVRTKKYTGGGAKFQNGDTIFARITPCLQNGKIAKVDGFDGEIGFGSTEFFVFRAREGVSDPDYLYYLARTDAIRSVAEKSMTGASGRQRANLSAVEKVEVHAPSLDEQKEIAGTLSAYDDLIENNTRRIRALEAMAQAIYTEWFVRFRFPGHEKVNLIDSGTEFGNIPEGWEVKRLGDVADLQWGDTKTTKASYMDDGFPAYSASGFDGRLDYFDFDRDGVVLSAIGAQCGQTWFVTGKWSCIKNTIRFWATTENASTAYIFYATLGKDFWPRRGSAQPFISQTDSRNLRILVSDKKIMTTFTDFANSALYDIRNMKEQNQKLRQARDILLPRLIGGVVLPPTSVSDDILTYLDNLHQKIQNERFIDPSVRDKILEQFHSACTLTKLPASDFLKGLDFQSSNLTIESCEGFIAQIRSVLWLHDFGFQKIKPLPPKKKEKAADFSAWFQNKKCSIEVFCLTGAHEQQKSHTLNAYVNFSPPFCGSKFERDFLDQAIKKKEQLDATADTGVKILLCVINSISVWALNNKSDFDAIAEHMWRQLEWGDGYYVGLLTGRIDLAGAVQDTIFPRLEI